MSPRIPVAYGTANFGPAGSTGATVTSLEDAQRMLDVYLRYGNTIDTSNRYTEGNSERYLAKLDVKHATIDTKLGLPHSAVSVREAVKKSVATLSPKKIRVLYLHMPDHTVPYEETVKEINELYKEGYFKEFGLSNFASWEVAEIYNVAKLNGWVVPTVYQGRYNAIDRSPETELFPALRKYGIRFHAYSPLAGSVLTGRFLSDESFNNPGSNSRFNPELKSPFVAMWRGIYGPLLPFIKELNDSLVRSGGGISLTEASLRWIQHHSAMKESDVVLLGSSKPEQLEESLKASDGGPLPEEVVKAFEEAWGKIKGHTTPYFF